MEKPFYWHENVLNWVELSWVDPTWTELNQNRMVSVSFIISIEIEYLYYKTAFYGFEMKIGVIWSLSIRSYYEYIKFKLIASFYPKPISQNCIKNRLKNHLKMVLVYGFKTSLESS